VQPVDDVSVLPATPDRWSDVVAVLQGPGDPGRCWCRYFFRGTVVDRAHADANREALRRQVHDDPPPGVLAYVDGDPLGWCAVAPRSGYTRLARSRLLACVPDPPHDDPTVWSVTCFVVRRPARRRGLSSALLAGAVDHARRGGAGLVEAYPVDPGIRRPAGAAELYPGLLPVFLRAGFTEVARPQPARAVVRRPV
jgi:GNAT superfamily N-acetyltransferase